MGCAGRGPVACFIKLNAKRLKLECRDGPLAQVFF